MYRTPSLNDFDLLNRLRIAKSSPWAPWGAQVLPRSVVVAIAREPPRLSRMFSISVPVRVSTTAASVVLGLAVVPRDQVSPWSFDHSTVERGSRRSPRSGTLPLAARYASPRAGTFDSLCSRSVEQRKASHNPARPALRP